MSVELVIGIAASILGAMALLLWNGINSRLAIVESEQKSLLTATAVANARFEAIMNQLEEIKERL